MTNIEMDVKDKILTIKIDLSERNGVSPSKKTIRVASTEGNKKIPGFEEIKIGINAMIKNPDYVAEEAEK